MPLYPRIIGPKEMAELEAERCPDVFTPPSEWVDSRYAILDPHRRYTVTEPVTIAGRSVFGNTPMSITYLPRPNGEMRFGSEGKFIDANLGQVQNGLHNIVLGTRKFCIGICEHSLVARHMGIEADIELQGARNFPNHDQGVKKEFDAVVPYLQDTGPANLMTVREPVGVDFGKGSYMLLHPDEGKKQFILDHELSHAKNVLGTQRVNHALTPASLAYISAARTICYKWLLRNGLLLSEKFGSQHEHFLNLTRRNVLLVGKELLNPNPVFDTDGDNKEALMHEVVDKAGAAALLPGRFVGKMVTRRTSHSRDVAALKLLHPYLILIEGNNA